MRRSLEDLACVGPVKLLAVDMARWLVYRNERPCPYFSVLRTPVSH